MGEDLVYKLGPGDAADWQPVGGGILTRRPILFTESTGSVAVRDVEDATSPGSTSSAVVRVRLVADADGADVGARSPTHGGDWSDPNINGGVYSGAANWYAAGNAVYTPTVRYPAGALITATVVAVAGGPIVATNTNDPDGFPGTGYAPGDTGTIQQGSNSSAHYRVDTVDGGGAVTAYTITNPGSGYFPAQGLNTTATSGSGTFLTLNVTEVDAQPVTDPGIVVVDVIGFGVPAGDPIVPVKL